MRVLGLIPARGGSKGVPRKNIRLLAGRPLIDHTLAAACASAALTTVVVTTDDDEIAAIAETHNRRALRRPPELAADDTPMLPVIRHALDTLTAQGESFDAVALLQPTAPLRTAADIDAGVALLTSEVDAVVAVTAVPGHHHPDWQFILVDGQLRLYNGRPIGQIITQRQALSTTYTRNGALYVTTTRALAAYGTLYGERVRAYIMPAERSINIDGELDFLLAEALLQRQPSHAQEAI